MMRGSRNDAKFRSLKRKDSDYANLLSQLDSKKPYRKKAKNGDKFRDQEVDRDYHWLLDLLLKTHNKQTKVGILENVCDYETENDVENEHEDEDVNDEDPQYCLFLQNLVPNGRSYKLKISKDDESPRFLHYEEDENSVGEDDDDLPTYGQYVNSFPRDMQIVRRDEQMLLGKKGECSAINEVSRKKKTAIEPYRGNVDPCFLLFLKGYNPSTGKFIHEGKEVEYEKTEEQLVLAEKQRILAEKQQVLAKQQQLLAEQRALLAEQRALLAEKQQVLAEKRPLLAIKPQMLAEKQPLLANKQPVLAVKRLSLKEKLLRILRKPYSKREYKELKEYAEEQKPICRLLPLRQRSVSSALDGMTKSVLDDSPGCFRRRFKAAKQEGSKAKALNLLRMLRFWLEHLPNEDIFEPWFDKEILEVLPLPRIT